VSYVTVALGTARLVHLVDDDEGIGSAGAQHHEKRKGGLRIAPAARRAAQHAVVRGAGAADLPVAELEQLGEAFCEPRLADSRRADEEQWPEADPGHAGAAPQPEVADNPVDSVAQVRKLGQQRRAQLPGFRLAASERQRLGERLIRRSYLFAGGAIGVADGGDHDASRRCCRQIARGSRHGLAQHGRRGDGGKPVRPELRSPDKRAIDLVPPCAGEAPAQAGSARQDGGRCRAVLLDRRATAGESNGARVEGLSENHTGNVRQLERGKEHQRQREIGWRVKSRRVACRQRERGGVAPGPSALQRIEEAPLVVILRCDPLGEERAEVIEKPVIAAQLRRPLAAPRR
jgi:hypothetical protein